MQVSALAPAAGPDRDRDPGLALYVHWPFCKAKCPYCDFNSHVRAAVDHPRWARALVRELEHMAGELGRARRPLRSVFFGGGTPSLMAVHTVAAVLNRAEALFGFEPGVEITLEANPTSVEAEKFRGFRTAGVNRVSLGVQALNDVDLKALGREHTAREALEAVRLAACVFERFSFDLIYARPHQTAIQWRAELEAALDDVGDHLSVYQLTIEAGTPFHALAQRGRLKVLPDEVQADLYAITQDVLGEAGMPAYEVSNHARAGGESRHNLVYWRSGDFIGVGPGAAGRIPVGGNRTGTSTERVPERWLQAVEAKGHGELSREDLDTATQSLELLMMGLRLNDGVPLVRLAELTGGDWRQAFDPQALVTAQEIGTVLVEPDHLRLSTDGRLKLNSVLVDLLP